MLSLSYLFERRKPYDSHGSFVDFPKISGKLNAVKASKKMTVKKDQVINPIPASNRLQIKNQDPPKVKITVRMGMIDQEN